MRPKHFFDTNVLLYSISKDPAESEKRAVAIELLQLPAGSLSVQVFQEFYVQATRKSRTNPLPHDTAVKLIRVWTRFAVQDITFSVLSLALSIREKHGFSYWDSAVLSAASTLGCKTLYSEDLSHGAVVAGVEIINPFR